jgi:thiol-disulfide isomerase/thioredoxin
VRRLNLKGKDIALAGPALGGNGTLDIRQFKGRVVAVVFWASWFQPSLEEIPVLAELYKTYQKDGFEIIGVNLDNESQPALDAVRDNKIAWRQIQDEGGMDSGQIAIDYGIIAPGTMFLVGRDGKVISNSASIDDLKKLVPDLVKQ